MLLRPALRIHLLQPPEAYFTLYPRPSNANGTPPPAGAPTAARTATAVAPHIRSKETLISRFGLESRLSATDVAPSPGQDAGGRAVWEDTAEKREASLRERKARMILAARQYVQSYFLAYHRKLTDRSPWLGKCWLDSEYPHRPLLHNYLGSFLLIFLFLPTGLDCNNYSIDFDNRISCPSRKLGVI